MDSQSLMTRIMDKLDSLDTKVTRVEDTVKRHDEYTFPQIQKAIEDLQNARKIDVKVVEDLCRVVSRSDGRMNTMEADIIANSAANKMFNDMATTWKVGKWVIGSTISFIIFLLAVKSLIHGSIKEGLNTIRNLIF